MGTSTLLLDTATNDLVLDAHNNIAVASMPYSLAQDAASAIKTFLAEVFWDTTLGVPYLSEILAHNPPLSLLKQLLADPALSVPDVASAKCFIAAVSGRIISGQIQVTSASTGQTATAEFTVINPQGSG